MYFQGHRHKKKRFSEKVIFHEDRLIAALNKHWRALTENQYWDELDMSATNNAIVEANFPQESNERIWETKRKPFEVF